MAGNSGTHEGAAEEIEQADVWKMLDFAEVVLEALYAPDHSAKLAHVERIIDAKKMVK